MTKFILCLLLCLFATSYSQDTCFEDTFQLAELGRKWRATSGSWKMSTEGLSITTNDYDELLSSDCYMFGSSPFTIEATLMGDRAGLFFRHATSRLRDSTDHGLHEGLYVAIPARPSYGLRLVEGGKWVSVSGFRPRTTDGCGTSFLNGMT